MPERASATEQLERILYLLPAAARDGGVAIDELASALGVEPRDVLRDIGQVTARAYYHPAGGAENLQITVGTDRVEVFTGGEFHRPRRLAPREALALGLGLRLAAMDATGAARARRLALARRLEAALAKSPPDELVPPIALDEGDGGDGLRALLADAARDGRRCELRYVKPTSKQPEVRRVEPYVLVSAEGAWYVLGRDVDRDAMRAFRLDRVLEAEPTEELFEADPDFDATQFLAHGRVYRSGSDIEVLVRYAPRVAGWIREELDPAERDRSWEDRPDGAVAVRHRVADTGWIVRHVLGYGGEAVVERPAEVRAAVREAAQRVARDAAWV